MSSSEDTSLERAISTCDIALLKQLYVDTNTTNISTKEEFIIRILRIMLPMIKVKGFVINHLLNIKCDDEKHFIYAIFIGLAKDPDSNSLEKIKHLFRHIDNGTELLNILSLIYNNFSFDGEKGSYRRAIIRLVLNHYKNNNNTKLEDIFILTLEHNCYVSNDYSLYIVSSLLRNNCDEVLKSIPISTLKNLATMSISNKASGKLLNSILKYLPEDFTPETIDLIKHTSYVSFFEEDL